MFFDSSYKEKKQNRPFYFAPSNLIRHFSFGFPELSADILWMRLIQDIDFCSSEKGLPVYNGQIKYQCTTGWSYKMTDAITELDPRFLKPYTLSASIMGIIMGDKLGAKKIYDKGVNRFPNNWKLHFYAGHHYLLELKEEQKASQLLIRAADLGGPFWLYVLAAKTYKKIGKLLLSKKVLMETLKKDLKGTYKKALQHKLQQIEKEIQQSKTSL